MNSISSMSDLGEIQSIDISLKKIPFLSIDSNLSVNALKKILIKNPHLVNITDEKKETFLSYAIKRNNNPIINLILISSILDLSYTDKKGNTYLHISVIQQNINLIQALLKKGISTNTKNNDGNTALHFAYYINNIEIINILKSNNTNLNIKNNEGIIAEEMIPGNDIDKIAGYEVHMNFDFNIDDELRYDYPHNKINEEFFKKLDNNIEQKDKKNNTTTKIKKSQTKEINKKRKGYTEKKKINNKKTNNNKNIDIKHHNKNNNNCKNTKSNNKDNKSKYIKNSNKEDISDEYNGLISLPFHSGIANRKISNIDRIYNENDRFIRKESECYQFYSELLEPKKEIINTPVKSNKKELSKIAENNNISEGNINDDKKVEQNEIKINSSSHLNKTTKDNDSSLLQNSNNNINKINNSNNITIMQNIMINCSNKPLLDFLLQINIQKYYNNFNKTFGDIYKIIEDAKNGRYITDSQLKSIGIDKPGDRAKFQIRVQEKAGLFEYAIPKNIYYKSSPLIRIEDDKNVYNLYKWLKNIKLEKFLSNFINNGYFSIDLVLLQMISYNPLNDTILKDEFGIEKLGYRTRILNKLKEEAPNYLNKLKETIITFHTIDYFKICSGCIIY